MKLNHCGLSWEEWAAAANIQDPHPSPRLRKAWRDAEDPTDHRAASIYPYLCFKCKNTVPWGGAPKVQFCVSCNMERHNFKSDLASLVAKAIFHLDEDQADYIFRQSEILRVPLTGYLRKLASIPELVVADDVMQE